MKEIKNQAKAYTDTKFADVNADMYYASYIAWAVEKRIVKGMSETSFAPDSKVTREQLGSRLNQDYEEGRNTERKIKKYV